MSMHVLKMCSPGCLMS
uniref:Uncharacterized protein n=1 Tax=Arundo donax TaxID=35708 RepID=A0A0A9BEV9_ARUDO